jgi:hypothetical protein
VLPLFEAMTAALLFHKPDRPKEFLIEKLMSIRSGEAKVRRRSQTLYSAFFARPFRLLLPACPSGGAEEDLRAAPSVSTAPMSLAPPLNVPLPGRHRKLACTGMLACPQGGRRVHLSDRWGGGGGGLQSRASFRRRT